MNQQHDDLRPTIEQSVWTLTKSRRVWYSKVQEALHQKNLPPSCANLPNLLFATPSIPRDSTVKELMHNNNIILEGRSTWDLGSSTCELSQKQSKTYTVVIGCSSVILCDVVNWSPGLWPGFRNCDRQSAESNYLLPFTLGWCFVLSAHQHELRKANEHDKISYTDIQASLCQTETSSQSVHDIEVDIGNATSAESRWWAAVLAGGCGWKASLNRSARNFYPPWSCHLTDENLIGIHYIPADRKNSLPTTQPFSSFEAYNYLLSFAKERNILDQLLAAFTAALTVPEHLRFGTKVQLPRPQRQGHPNKIRPQSYLLRYFPSIQQLPHFMALSCIPGIISSCLCGPFWEPGINCNLASEWLHPILKEIVPGLADERSKFTLARIMAYRRPNVAPLWLGATLTGLSSRIPEILRSFGPPISSEAAVWTQSPQSFMDPGRYRRRPSIDPGNDDRKVLHREDELRLLYLTDIQSDQYPSPPSCPWSPLGTVIFTDTALAVQQHASCGHVLVYHKWTWSGLNKHTLDDYGYRKTRPVDIHTFWESFTRTVRTSLCRKRDRYQRTRVNSSTQCDDQISQLVTRNVFTWTLVDGVRPDDAIYWNHEWLQGILEADESDEE